ncbi:glycoside hydrolase family 13 protein [Candidatus Enterococcus murrayae]|uniref:Alpha-glucosidase n=1 Tax=Candidatus Enterococcus murrayae TaxID=2815321 RepID=A0ABS3HFT9_9ENTE|nr:alpha-glucosidase [Enterococcus sp. MJM16]MBO0452302.1 alpha-glucosidase [Enterococcus sp. MJM16]
MSEWWKRAVFYQIYPKSFRDTNNDGIGDLNGIREKLPYLRELGIDALWISPIYLSPQVDNGYDVSDYRQIDPMFGTNQEMYQLIDEAHEWNIKIVMDFVANHTSDQCLWFQESRKSKDNFFSDFYIWKDGKSDGSAPNNWGSSFGGSAWSWDASRQQYYLHYYAKEQPDLNWENPTVREYIYDMMRFWKAKGVDGWRMDVITSISKNLDFPNNPRDFTTENQQNGPRMHEFIHEMNQEVLKPFRMMSVGESPAAKSTDAHLLVDPKREELDMIFTFEHMHVDRKKGDINGRWALKSMDLPDLKKILASWQTELRDKGWNALYFENHDRARVISRWGNDERYRYECATAFAIILHGLQGTPFIYQGEEIGMTNTKFELEEYEDIELRGNYEFYVEQQKTMSKEEFLKAVHKISRDNARTPMQWDQSANAGFSQAQPWFKVNPNYTQINVAVDQANEKSIFKLYQELIRLRHSERILTEGSFELLYPNDRALFIYQRKLEQEYWYILANMSEEYQKIPKELTELVGEFKIKNNSERSDLMEDLAPYEAFIVRRTSLK